MTLKLNTDTISLIYSLCALSRIRGGLRVPDLRNLNLCLLASWIQRHQDTERKLWRDIIDTKYNHDDPNIFCANNRGASPF
jgi:hypothetical protein